MPVWGGRPRPPPLTLIFWWQEVVDFDLLRGQRYSGRTTSTSTAKSADRACP